MRSTHKVDFSRFLKCIKALLCDAFYILYISYILCICVFFFLKAIIRACHEPGVSCSESMSLFSHYTEQINDDDDD